MKKLSVLLALCLLCTLCAAASADTGTLSKLELSSYTDSILKTALIDNRYEAEETDGGWLLRFKQYTLKTDAQKLTSSTRILAVIFDDLTLGDDCMGDLRGIKLNDSLQTLLSAYPLENASMTGTREEAVLYADGELPGQAAVGYLKRDGQRVTQITHYAYYMADSGVGVAAAVYDLRDGAVVRAELNLSMPTLTVQDAKDELAAFQDVLGQTEYSAYLSAAEGGEALPFDRDDLIFSGMDFLDLTPEDAQNVLGDDFAEEWLEDGDTFIHVMEWNAATITFLHDRDRNLLRVDSLYMDEDTLEGPRGIRIGDRQENVISCFASEAGVSDGDVTYLYGAAGDESYGLAEYVAAGETCIRYGCTVEDHAVTLILNMREATLTSMILQME